MPEPVDVVTLWQSLIDSPQIAVAAFFAGWAAGLACGYVIARMVLR